MTTSTQSTALMHLDTEARAARNLRTAESIAARNARIVELAKAGQSTWKLATVSQLSQSTIRGIVRDGKRNAARRKPHSFGLERGCCIFCGVHRDDPKAAESCASTATGTIITL